MLGMMPRNLCRDARRNSGGDLLPGWIIHLTNRPHHLASGETAMHQQHDPLDAIAQFGLRTIWVPDFENRVTLVPGVKVLLVDPRIDRLCAANVVLRQYAPSNLLRPRTALR